MRSNGAIPIADRSWAAHVMACPLGIPVLPFLEAARRLDCSPEMVDLPVFNVSGDALVLRRCDAGAEFVANVPPEAQQTRPSLMGHGRKEIRTLPAEVAAGPGRSTWRSPGREQPPEPPRQAN